MGGNNGVDIGGNNVVEGGGSSGVEGVLNNGVLTPLNNSFDPNAGLSLRILPSTYINIRLFNVYLPILSAGRIFNQAKNTNQIDILSYENV